MKKKKRKEEDLFPEELFLCVSENLERWQRLAGLQTLKIIRHKAKLKLRAAGYRRQRKELYGMLYKELKNKKSDRKLSEEQIKQAIGTNIEYKALQAKEDEYTIKAEEVDDILWHIRDLYKTVPGMQGAENRIMGDEL